MRTVELTDRQYEDLRQILGASLETCRENVEQSRPEDLAGCLLAVQSVVSIQGALDRAP